MVPYLDTSTIGTYGTSRTRTVVLLSAIYLTLVLPKAGVRLVFLAAACFRSSPRRTAGPPGAGTVYRVGVASASGASEAYVVGS